MAKRASLKQKFEGFQNSFKADGDKAKVRYKSVSALMDGLRCETQTRNFRITVDEQKSLGGNDTGPNPVELILTALGACQEITYRLYADLMDIPVNGITVEVMGDIDLCGFYDVDDAARPGYSNITADIQIDSPANDEDLQRLKQAVDAHCPVLDIIGNVTPVAINVSRKDLGAAAGHAL